MRDVIDEFDGKYSFLSNFYPAPVDYQGYHFENSEVVYLQIVQNALDEKSLCVPIGSS